MGSMCAWKVNNFGQLGLRLRLIDAATGMMAWNAHHERPSSYMFIKSSLKDIAGDYDGSDRMTELSRPGTMAYSR